MKEEIGSCPFWYEKPKDYFLRIEKNKWIYGISLYPPTSFHIYLVIFSRLASYYEKGKSCMQR